MYKIGQFSKIAKVTVKALRFYEEEGLLKPRRVDAANGYRYYSSDQLPQAYRILALRQCGFSIPEIRRVLAGRNLTGLFAEKKRELEKRATETAIQLASIDHYIGSLEGDGGISHEIVIKELPRVLVYSMRTIVPSYDAYFDLIPKIGEKMTAANPEMKIVDDPPYCFIMYHDGEYKDHDIDIEFCEAITSLGVEPDGIKFKTIERVSQAACVLHKGPYTTLPEAYSAVFKWIDDNNFIPSQCPRESYIDGIWNANDPNDWLTEVQVPVQPK